MCTLHESKVTEFNLNKAELIWLLLKKAGYAELTLDCSKYVLVLKQTNELLTRPICHCDDLLIRQKSVADELFQISKHTFCQPIHLRGAHSDDLVDSTMTESFSLMSQSEKGMTTTHSSQNCEFTDENGESDSN